MQKRLQRHPFCLFDKKRQKDTAESAVVNAPLKGIDHLP